MPLTYRGDAVEIGAVKPLFKVRPKPELALWYDVSRDGQRFLVNTLSDQGALRRRSRWSSTGGRGPAADGPRDDWSFGGQGRSLRADEQLQTEFSRVPRGWALRRDSVRTLYTYFGLAQDISRGNPSSALTYEETPRGHGRPVANSVPNTQPNNDR